MRMNSQGLVLLKAAEGCRLTAYRDAVGILTIAYGHTSRAGLPQVVPGLRVSMKQASDILQRDIDIFARGIAGLIKRALNSNQESALISFAYNAGVPAFAGSSVLRAVNAGKFELVPRRLNLWIKAKGRVLSGLVKRRAAEGSLFMLADGNNFMAAEIPHFRADEVAEMQEVRGLLDVPDGTPLGQSSTMWVTLASAATGIGAAAQQAIWQARDLAYSFDLSPRRIAALTAIFVIVACALWVINERHKKAVDEDV